MNDDQADLQHPDPTAAGFTPPPPPTAFETQPLPTVSVPTEPLVTQAPSYEHLPTEPVQQMSPPSSVVVGSSAPAKKKRNVVPWALAGVGAIGAASFGVLWSSKSGEVNDLTEERDGLSAQVVELGDEIDRVTEEADTAAESAQEEIDGLTSDLAQAGDDAAELQDQVDTLEAQVEELENQPPTNAGISDTVALRLGQELGRGFSPPLNDAEATCFGRAFYEAVGLEVLIEVGISTEEPSNAVLARLGQGVFDAADACDISLSRLPN